MNISGEITDTQTVISQLLCQGEVCGRLPCTEEVIDELCRRAAEEPGDHIPEEYLNLLRITDGVRVSNNARIYSAEEFIEENILWRKNDPEYDGYLIIGYQGSSDLYLSEKRTGRYRMADFFTADEYFGSSDTFAEFIRRVLYNQNPVVSDQQLKLRLSTVICNFL